MPPKHVPKHAAPKKGPFKLPGLPGGSQNGKTSSGSGREWDFGRRRKAGAVEPSPAHNSHVRRRAAPRTAVEPPEPAQTELPSPEHPPAPAAKVTPLPSASEQPAPAPKAPAARSSEEYFDSLVASRTKTTRPAAQANRGPTEPNELRPPVSTASDDSAHQAARHETGSTIVDDPDIFRVKSAIRGGGEAWDPFLTDPEEPEPRRFRRNLAVSDLDKVKTRKRKPHRPATTHERQQHQTLGQWFKEIIILGIVAVLTAVLLTNYVVQAFFIPSVSMENTLQVNDRVLVNKLVYNFRDPKPGEMVVFTSPDKDQAAAPEVGPVGRVMNDVAQGLGLRSSVQDLIKRVIAVEGQTVEVKIGSVFVDGKQLNEPYRKDILPIPDYPPFKVPEGTVFVMGDNRNQSHDSRAFGPIDKDTIVGKAFALIWPMQRFRWFSS